MLPFSGTANRIAAPSPPVTRRRYLGRLSGPLLDRVDLRVRLDPVKTVALLGDHGAESSAVVAGRVAAARTAAATRWGEDRSNTTVPTHTLRDRRFRLSRAVTEPLAMELDQGLLSARGFFRVIRTAWTMADLDGRTRPDKGDVAEAIELRRGTAA